MVHNIEQQLTPWWRVLLKKLAVPHLVINSPNFTETASLILNNNNNNNNNNNSIQCYTTTNSMLQSSSSEAKSYLPSSWNSPHFMGPVCLIIHNDNDDDDDDNSSNNNNDMLYNK
jgi:hypothetical protein